VSTAGAYRRHAASLSAVLLLHALVFSLALRADRGRRPPKAADESLAVWIVRRQEWPREQPPTPPTARAPRARAPAPSPAPAAAAAPPPEAPSAAGPRIDWERAAVDAARASAATAAAGAGYRDLAGAPPAVRAWIEGEHMERAPAGIPWRHSRVEFTPEGFPIIHINDHCVSLPMLAFLVFCKIGHIEADGHLFDSLRAPREP
jgi:hypothetical protein